ncbi:MAG: sulfotransferase family protein [Anaerolineae bacterium]
MTYDIRGFAAFTRRAFSATRQDPGRLTPKRFGLLAGFYLLYGTVEGITWMGFALDNLLARGYRAQPINRPVFIIGNPRSGTTFLQRILSRDTQTFAPMRLWEILFAPSIVQRILVAGGAKIDRLLGAPLRKFIESLDARIRQKNPVHPTGLLASEEDQYLFLHIWSTVATWQFAGILGPEAECYTHFDAMLPAEEKSRIMRFYSRAIQRHLYFHEQRSGTPRHYLSKNPSGSPKVDALYAEFDDPRIIYLVRNPLQMIPSMISTLDYTWQVLGDPPEPYACRDYVLEMAHYWYTYPLQRLAEAPPKSYIIVNFNDMVESVDHTVERIYRRFDLEITPEYRRVLEQETTRARQHQSNHHYSLEAMGLTREQIVADYRDIFDRFGFDTQASSL